MQTQPRGMPPPMNESRDETPVDTTCSPYRNVEEKVPGIRTDELRLIIPDPLLIIMGGFGVDIFYDLYFV